MPNDRREKSLFSTPKIPTTEQPTPAPDEEALDGNRRRRIASARASGGRTSTVLSSGGAEKLGG